MQTLAPPVICEAKQAQQRPLATIEEIGDRFGTISTKVAILIEKIQKHRDKISSDQMEIMTERAAYIRLQCVKIIGKLKQEASDQSGCSDFASNLSNTLILIDRIQNILLSGIQAKPETRLLLQVKADMIESQLGVPTNIVNRIENDGLNPLGMGLVA